MNKDLLPPNATRLERVAARVNASIGEIAVPLRKLWSPSTCPVKLLPYLAWAFSVDRWDSRWSTATKRKAIADAFFLHRYKGTTIALRRVVEPFGYFLQLHEWWDINTEPGTFTLDIGVADQGITDETYQELERLINDVKPCSRHLLGLALHLQTTGPFYVGAAAYDGNVLTVYPYFPSEISVSGSAVTGGAIHSIDILEVNSNGH